MMSQVEKWYLTEWERENTLYTFRFGYLKLAPLKARDEYIESGGDVGSGLVARTIITNFISVLHIHRYCHLLMYSEANYL
ncbi:unnamed protein product [Anisakis simplex]|uniref:SPX domain-containing protein n=1 Tax=Anisakis simplex TaxID=6269 RepID=A0A0M3JPH5_ANISI|nr:unnamed protein product [Anisakis simplex]